MGDISIETGYVDGNKSRVGWNLRVSRMAIRWLESLMYDGVFFTSGFMMESRNDDILSVGPWQPLTMGRMPWGFLWSFLRKYIFCVLVLVGGFRKSFVSWSMYPVWCRFSIKLLIFPTSWFFGSELQQCVSKKIDTAENRENMIDVVFFRKYLYLFRV